MQRVVRAVRLETTRQLLGLDADPDESPENSYAAVRAIFARDDFKSALRAHKSYVDTHGERGCHIKMCTPYFLGHQVDGSEDMLFTVVASVWQLLAIGRQMNSGWPIVLHCDASFNVCRADISLYTIGLNLMGGPLNHRPQSYGWPLPCLYVLMTTAKPAILYKKLSVRTRCNRICPPTSRRRGICLCHM